MASLAVFERILESVDLRSRETRSVETKSLSSARGKVRSVPVPVVADGNALDVVLQQEFSVYEYRQPRYEGGALEDVNEMVSDGFRTRSRNSLWLYGQSQGEPAVQARPWVTSVESVDGRITSQTLHVRQMGPDRLAFAEFEQLTYLDYLGGCAVSLGIEFDPSILSPPEG